MWKEGIIICSYILPFILHGFFIFVAVLHLIHRAIVCMFFVYLYFTLCFVVLYEVDMVKVWRRVIKSSKVILAYKSEWVKLFHFHFHFFFFIFIFFCIINKLAPIQPVYIKHQIILDCLYNNQFGEVDSSCIVILHTHTTNTHKTVSQTHMVMMIGFGYLWWYSNRTMDIFKTLN